MKKATGLDFFSVPVELGVSYQPHFIPSHPSVADIVILAQRRGEGHQPSRWHHRKGEDSSGGRREGTKGEHREGHQLRPQPSSEVNHPSLDAMRYELDCRAAS